MIDDSSGSGSDIQVTATVADFDISIDGGALPLIPDLPMGLPDNSFQVDAASLVGPPAPLDVTEIRAADGDANFTIAQPTTDFLGFDPFAVQKAEDALAFNFNAAEIPDSHEVMALLDDNAFEALVPEPLAPVQGQSNFDLRLFSPVDAGLTVAAQSFDFYNALAPSDYMAGLQHELSLPLAQAYQEPVVVSPPVADLNAEAVVIAPVAVPNSSVADSGLADPMPTPSNGSTVENSALQAAAADVAAGGSAPAADAGGSNVIGFQTLGTVDPNSPLPGLSIYNSLVTGVAVTAPPQDAVAALDRAKQTYQTAIDNPDLALANARIGASSQTEALSLVSQMNVAERNNYILTNSAGFSGVNAKLEDLNNQLLSAESNGNVAEINRLTLEVAAVQTTLRDVGTLTAAAMNMQPQGVAALPDPSTLQNVDASLKSGNLTVPKLPNAPNVSLSAAQKNLLSGTTAAAQAEAALASYRQEQVAAVANTRKDILDLQNQRASQGQLAATVIDTIAGSAGSLSTIADRLLSGGYEVTDTGKVDAFNALAKTASLTGSAQNDFLSDLRMKSDALAFQRDSMVSQGDELFNKSSELYNQMLDLKSMLGPSDPQVKALADQIAGVEQQRADLAAQINAVALQARDAAVATSVSNDFATKQMVVRLVVQANTDGNKDAATAVMNEVTNLQRVLFDNAKGVAAELKTALSDANNQKVAAAQAAAAALQSSMNQFSIADSTAPADSFAGLANADTSKVGGIASVPVATVSPYLVNSNQVSFNVAVEPILPTVMSPEALARAQGLAVGGGRGEVNPPVVNTQAFKDQQVFIAEQIRVWVEANANANYINANLSDGSVPVGMIAADMVGFGGVAVVPTTAAEQLRNTAAAVGALSGASFGLNADATAAFRTVVGAIATGDASNLIDKYQQARREVLITQSVYATNNKDAYDTGKTVGTVLVNLALAPVGGFSVASQAGIGFALGGLGAVGNRSADVTAGELLTQVTKEGVQQALLQGGIVLAAGEVIAVASQVNALLREARLGAQITGDLAPALPGGVNTLEGVVTRNADGTLTASVPSAQPIVTPGVSPGAVVDIPKVVEVPRLTVDAPSVSQGSLVVPEPVVMTPGSGALTSPVASGVAKDLNTIDVIAREVPTPAGVPAEVPRLTVDAPPVAEGSLVVPEPVVVTPGSGALTSPVEVPRLTMDPPAVATAPDVVVPRAVDEVVPNVEVAPQVPEISPTPAKLLSTNEASVVKTDLQTLRDQYFDDIIDEQLLKQGTLNALKDAGVPSKNLSILENLDSDTLLTITNSGDKVFSILKSTDPAVVRHFETLVEQRKFDAGSSLELNMQALIMLSDGKIPVGGKVLSSLDSVGGLNGGQALSSFRELPNVSTRFQAELRNFSATDEVTVKIYSEDLFTSRNIETEITLNVDDLFRIKSSDPTINIQIIKSDRPQLLDLNTLSSKLDADLPITRVGQNIEGYVVEFKSGMLARFSGDGTALSALAQDASVVKISGETHLQGWFENALDVPENLRLNTSDLVDHYAQQLGSVTTKTPTDLNLNGNTVFHGTIDQMVDSVVAGPQNVGKGFGGPGLYIAMGEDRGVAAAYSSMAKDAAANRAANIGLEVKGPVNNVIMEGSLNLSPDMRVGVFTITRDGVPDLANGRLPAFWADDPALVKVLEAKFDVLQINGARSAGLNLDTDSFLVIHESAGANAISWKTVQTEGGQVIGDISTAAKETMGGSSSVSSAQQLITPEVSPAVVGQVESIKSSLPSVGNEIPISNIDAVEVPKVTDTLSAPAPALEPIPSFAAMNDALAAQRKAIESIYSGPLANEPLVQALGVNSTDVLPVAVVDNLTSAINAQQVMEVAAAKVAGAPTDVMASYDLKAAIADYSRQVDSLTFAVSNPAEIAEVAASNIEKASVNLVHEANVVEGITNQTQRVLDGVVVEKVQVQGTEKLLPSTPENLQILLTDTAAREFQQVTVDGSHSYTVIQKIESGRTTDVVIDVYQSPGATGVTVDVYVPNSNGPLNLRPSPADITRNRIQDLAPTTSYQGQMIRIQTADLGALDTDVALALVQREIKVSADIVPTNIEVPNVFKEPSPDVGLVQSTPDSATIAAAQELPRDELGRIIVDNRLYDYPPDVLQSWKTDIQDAITSTDPSKYMYMQTGKTFTQYVGVNAPEIPVQGFKFHIGVEPEKMVETIESILPWLREQNLLHKIVADPTKYINGMAGGSNIGGKLITVYVPAGREVEIGLKLDQKMLEVLGKDSPFAGQIQNQSDGLFGSSGAVSYRYGKNVGTEVHSNDLVRLNSDGNIVGANGKVVLDTSGSRPMTLADYEKALSDGYSGREVIRVLEDNGAFIEDSRTMVVEGGIIDTLAPYRWNGRDVQWTASNGATPEIVTIKSFDQNTNLVEIVDSTGKQINVSPDSIGLSVVDFYSYTNGKGGMVGVSNMLDGLSPSATIGTTPAAAVIPPVGGAVIDIATVAKVAVAAASAGAVAGVIEVLTSDSAVKKASGN